MADEFTPEEPDFAKHVRNVLEDLFDGELDGVDEAYEAILEHPAAKRLLAMKVIGPLDDATG